MRGGLTYFATAIPGIGKILSGEISRMDSASVQRAVEFDGRNDVVVFSARGGSDVLGLRTAEDVFVEVSKARTSGAVGAVAGRLLPEEELARALSVFASRTRPLKARMTFRVVTRLLSEGDFLRTQLRDELVEQARQVRPKWSVADPAELELWALETKPNVIRLGLRLSDPSMRSRGGRTDERPGSLRPTVAAAMLQLLGGDVAGRRVFDPCCGSGTVLREALALGLQPIGGDIDVRAVRAARANLRGARAVIVADARRLPFADSTLDYLVSNLPFGKQFSLQEQPRSWYDRVLSEIARVLAPDARVVLLTGQNAAFERSLVRQKRLALIERLELRLLGMPAVLWSLRRS